MANLREITAPAKDLEGLARGDQESFAAIFDRYSLLVLRIAHLILEDKKLAKSVVEDVFVDVWERREYWAVIDRFHAALIRAVLRRCIIILERRFHAS